MKTKSIAISATSPFSWESMRDKPFFQSVIDQLPFGVLITQPPGSRILFINKEGAMILGVDDVDIGNQTDLKDVFFKAGGKCFYSPQDISYEDTFVPHNFLQNFDISKRFEVQIQQPKGQKKYVSVSASPVTDEGRRAIAFVSILEDVNTKKENELKIRRDLQRLEYALNSAVDGLWEWDVRNDMGYLSPRYHEIYDFKDGEFPGDIKFWHSMLHPEDREPALTRLVNAIKSPNDNYTSTYRMKTRDGKYRWILSKAIVTQRGTGGNVEKMVGTHQDISERVALEKHLKNANINLQKEVARQTRHLKNANQELETILNSSSESIWVFDGDGIVLKTNKAASETIGFNAQTFIGKKAITLVEDGLIDRSVTIDVLKTKKQVSRMQKVLKTGKELLVTGTPVFDEDGHISLIVLNETDLTTLNDLRREIETVQTTSKRFQEELNHISMLELQEQNIVARSKEMKQLITMAMKLAKMDVSNILILGPSGTGKSLIAKFIHNNGPRKQEPFLQVNCAALPETLMEAELFGYEKGAFTGAQNKGKIGLFELAQNGTIFLDEIGELSLNVQAKILKCIEEKEVMHLGGLEVIKINCNIIAATNADLAQKASDNSFRDDLFYRLNIFTLQIPPLKSRNEDILELSLMFLDKYNKKYGQNKKFSAECLKNIQQHDFPGNIRELKNRIQKAVVITDNDNITDLIDFRSDSEENKKTVECLPVDDSGLMTLLDQYEKKILIEAAEKFSSSRQLSKYLKTSQSTIVRRFRKHNLTHMLLKKPRMQKN